MLIGANCHRSQGEEHGVGEQRGEADADQADEQRGLLCGNQDTHRELAQGIPVPLQGWVWAVLACRHAPTDGGDKRDRLWGHGKVGLHGAVHGVCRRVQNFFSCVRHAIDLCQGPCSYTASLGSCQ